MGNYTISFEEAYPLVENYVRYFYNSGKFYSVAQYDSQEDLVGAICVKFLEKKYLEKYDPEITSVKYFIMVGVKHFFIDRLAGLKQTLSLDNEDANGNSYISQLPDSRDYMEEVEGYISYNQIMSIIPDTTNSKIVVNAPWGQEKATLRVLARLLGEGYNQAEISQMFINPSNGKHVSSGRVSQMVSELRVILVLSGVGV